MKKGFTAEARVTVRASESEVWAALTDPKIIKQYMFGTDIVSDWIEGNPIIWKGKWQGKKYEDKGTILRLEKERVLQYSHFSPLGGKPDRPENYHTVTIEILGSGGRTNIKLRQDNNETEQEKEHSEKNWQMMLENLKKILESG